MKIALMIFGTIGCGICSYLQQQLKDKDGE